MILDDIDIQTLDDIDIHPLRCMNICVHIMYAQDDIDI